MAKGSALAGAVLCVLLLGGCSWLSNWPPGGSRETAASAETSGLQPPPWHKQVGQTAPQNREQAIARLQRLESDVQQIRMNLDRMRPAVDRLAGVEKELQEILVSVQPAAGTPQHTSYRSPAGLGAERAPQPLTMKAAMPPPAKVDGVVSQLRFGVHPDKTRLVFDVGRKEKFTYRLDNESGVLIVDFPAAEWGGKPAMSVTGSPLFTSYLARQGNTGGTRVTLQLTQPVKVLSASLYPPLNSGARGHRVVLDIAGQ